jgi:hypothetical protein
MYFNPYDTNHQIKLARQWTFNRQSTPRTTPIPAELVGNYNGFVPPTTQEALTNTSKLFRPVGTAGTPAATPAPAAATQGLGLGNALLGLALLGGGYGAYKYLSSPKEEEAQPSIMDRVSGFVANLDPQTISTVANIAANYMAPRGAGSYGSSYGGGGYDQY